MQRYALRDDQWLKIKDFLPGREGHVGGTAPDNRLFVDACLCASVRSQCHAIDSPARSVSGA
jgi:transposase